MFGDDLGPMSWDARFQRHPWKRNSVEIQMGGYNSYYVESDSDAGSDNFKEEIGGRKINRSKTHMIFGIRCIETNHEVSVTVDTATKTTVVGLQPLSDLQEKSSDGTICTEDIIDRGETLSLFLDHLCSEVQSEGGNGNAFELIEIGADPIVSLAASKMFRGVDQRIVVRHPDEQRLRVLEHAHLYFNERSNENPPSFQTKSLQTDESLTKDEFSNGHCVVLFTSPKLVLSRLEEIMATFAGEESCRVLVPSAIISPQQLETYEYRVVAGTENTQDNKSGNSPALLEILFPK